MLFPVASRAFPSSPFLSLHPLFFPTFLSSFFSIFLSLHFFPLLRHIYTPFAPSYSILTQLLPC
jgi:hypothetical protein